MRKIVVFDNETKKKKVVTLTSDYEASIKAMPNYQKNKDILMLKAQKYLKQSMYLRQAL